MLHWSMLCKLCQILGVLITYFLLVVQFANPSVHTSQTAASSCNLTTVECRLNWRHTYLSSIPLTSLIQLYAVSNEIALEMRLSLVVLAVLGYNDWRQNHYILLLWFLFFILSAEMKDQPWDLNQTWPVGRKWCRFTNAPQKFRRKPSPKFEVQKTSNFRPLYPRLPHSTPRISGTKRRMDKQKCYRQSAIGLLQDDLHSVTLTQKRMRSVCLLWVVT